MLRICVQQSHAKVSEQKKSRVTSKDIIVVSPVTQDPSHGFTLVEGPVAEALSHLIGNPDPGSGVKVDPSPSGSYQLEMPRAHRPYFDI